MNSEVKQYIWDRLEQIKEIADELADDQLDRAIIHQIGQDIIILTNDVMVEMRG